MNSTETTLYDTLDSPLGGLLLVGYERAITGLYMLPEHNHAPSVGATWRRDGAPFAEARRQLRAYFAGELTEFDLPLEPSGTAFQREVWAALRKIPYGRTVGYAQLAAAVGRPSAARAVGAANGRNPISIVIPCHRVIGAAGALTGFGGGLERKRSLLELEAAHRLEAG